MSNMSNNYLMIHGASDDLIEVSGRITDEFNVPGQGTVRIEIKNGDKLSTFFVFCDFTGGWIAAVSHGSSRNSFPVEVEFTSRPGEWWEDTAVVFTLAPEDEVTVELAS